MKAEFEGKKFIRKQIRKARVQSDYSKYRMTVDFYVKKKAAKYPYDDYLYLFAEALQDDGDIIAIDLHLNNGYIDNLIVYSLKDKAINQFFNIDKSKASVGKTYVIDADNK